MPGSPPGRSWPARPAGMPASTAPSTPCAAAAPPGAWAAGAPMARLSPSARAHLVRALDGGAVSRGVVPPRRAARGAFRIVPGRRGFRAALRAARAVRAGMCPERVAWHRGSATLGRWHPETVRRIARNQVFLVARHYPGTAAVALTAWPMLVAQVLWGVVALRHGAGLGLAARKMGRAARIRAPCAGIARRPDPEVLERSCCDNERRSAIFKRHRVRSLLEAVLSSHRRWGKVTHGGRSASSSSRTIRQAEIGACLDAALAYRARRSWWWIMLRPTAPSRKWRGAACG